MKKQPHITEQTKNNQRSAFWSLYAQKPIEKISIKEITELAGYNRGTFYLYYNDVYDLLHQIEEEILGKITDVLNDSLEKNDTFDLSGQMGILLDLMQTYETYAAVCSCSKFLSQILKIVVKNFSEIVPGKQTQKEGFRPLIFLTYSMRITLLIIIEFDPCIYAVKFNFIPFQVPLYQAADVIQNRT